MAMVVVGHICTQNIMVVHSTVYLHRSTMAGMGPIPILSTTVLSDNEVIYIMNLSARFET